MPVLRSSRVQAVRMVVTSILSLVRIFPEVFSRWMANSPSLRFSWCWRSDGCREKQQQSDTRSNNQSVDDSGQVNRMDLDLFLSCLFLQHEWQTEGKFRILVFKTNPEKYKYFYWRLENCDLWSSLTFRVYHFYQLSSITSSGLLVT